MPNPGFGIGNKNYFESHLSSGICTHDDVRAVLRQALAHPSMRKHIQTYLSSFVRHLVVDEVFDANQLDLEIVELFSATGGEVTLIGDPWQALYGFRGARPDLVPRLIAAGGFASLPLSTSFRFETDEMRRIANELRAGAPVLLGPANEFDVLLASQWDDLWAGPPHVLPLSFGRMANLTDASAIVLLDHLVYSTFSRHAIFLPEALLLLGLDPHRYREDGPAALAGVTQVLVGASATAPTDALSALRVAIASLGAVRRPRASSAETEARQIERLNSLRIRLQATESLVPGMTIHQAKGREWNCVGLRLTPTEIARLASGLSAATEDDRRLYVAATRARVHTGLVA